MLLFLDVISPIPEFSVIEDNKLILNKKILKNSQEKLSDNIFPIYKKIDEKINLSENIKKIAVTIGPGSYTSLRVGASFISALSLSKNIPQLSFKIDDIVKYKNPKPTKKNIGFFIQSSNNQKFFCSIDKLGKTAYTKIEKEDLLFLSKINIVYYNHNKIFTEKEALKQIKFSFKKELLANYQNLDFTKEKNIEPIYISNNNILN